MSNGATILKRNISERITLIDYLFASHHGSLSMKTIYLCLGKPVRPAIAGESGPVNSWRAFIKEWFDHLYASKAHTTAAAFDELICVKRLPVACSNCSLYDVKYMKNQADKLERLVREYFRTHQPQRTYRIIPYYGDENYIETIEEEGENCNYELPFKNLG